MALPELIELTPLVKPVVAEITVPGSKSITNRALILAALGRGEVSLRGALWSEDTQVMFDSLRRLGFQVRAQTDEKEFCNRTLVIGGLGGEIPNAGTAENPLELFVGNAGTAARFLAALVCLGRGVYRLHGISRMHDRPQAGLFHALRQLGYRVESPNDRLPADIYGTGPRPRASCSVNIAESSQFASALMLCAEAGGWKVEVAGEDAEEAPYAAMTQRLIEAFPKTGSSFQIEPDTSSASYFLAAQSLAPVQSSITVASFPTSDWQIDTAFPRFLPLPDQISRRTQLGDSIMTAMILAPFASHPVQFTDLARLRAQECERVAAMRTELTKCGVPVIEYGERLTIFPLPKDGINYEAFVSAIRRGTSREALASAVEEALASAVRETVGPARKLRCTNFLKTGETKAFAKLIVSEKVALKLQQISLADARRLKPEAQFGDEVEVEVTPPEFARVAYHSFKQVMIRQFGSEESRGAEIETYNDHRMAMCFAILGLKVPGIRIQNPACVKKTFPNFFQKLAAAPPGGLGAAIVDCKTGRNLDLEELFAD